MRFKSQLDLISKSYNKDVQIRFRKKQKEDEENLLTPANIRNFDDAPTTKKVKQWLKNYANLCESELGVVRDYLIIQRLPYRISALQVSELLGATRLFTLKRGG